MKVLFVGNSYTFFNRLPEAIAAMAALRGRTLEPLTYLRGGASLQTHWCDNIGQDADRGLFCTEPDPDRVGGLDALLARKPDVTVLQGQSMDTITQPESFYHHAALLAERIRQAGCGHLVFYLTWAREAEPEQQMIITGAYRKAASELAAGLAPVGQAWADVRRQDPDVRLHQADGSHPTPAGSYLAACVLTEVLTGESCLALPARLEGVTDEDGGLCYDLPADRAEMLRRVAHTAVEDFAKDC